MRIETEWLWNNLTELLDLFEEVRRTIGDDFNGWLEATAPHYFDATSPAHEFAGYPKTAQDAIAGLAQLRDELAGDLAEAAESN